MIFRTGETGSRNLNIHPLSSSSVSLSWSLISSDTPCGGVTAPFKIQWRKTNQMTINVKYVEGFNTTITGLDSQTEYEFRILSCANRNDKSLWISFKLPAGESAVINNSDDIIPKPPDRLELSFLNRTSVNLTWSDDSNSVIYVACFIEASKGCDANMCRDDYKLRR